MDFTIFFQEQQKLFSKISLDVKRYLYHKIDWTNKAISIIGQRGVGKTTLLLQYIKENFQYSEKVLYISVDNPYFKTISLYEFAQDFEKQGGEILFLDEIHKYKDWSTHIKSIIDMTSLKVVFSGSSMLQIQKQDADLSRRVIVYKLANLSFREYLYINDILKTDSFLLDDIFKNHIKLALKICENIKPLEHFKEYVKTGCYPFFLEGKDIYHHELINIVNQILESDFPYITNINFSQIDKIKKLVYILSSSVPFTPNISELSKTSDISRPSMSEYLFYLELASIINSVNYKARGYSKIEKPDKLFLYNTNLMYAISKEPNIGNIRETFFVNQIKGYFYNNVSFLDEELLLSKKGDFIIENKYTIEVGGKNKSFEQIKDMENSFIISDNIEIGYKNKIPLWLFGFLY